MAPADSIRVTNDWNSMLNLTQYIEILGQINQRDSPLHVDMSLYSNAKPHVLAILSAFLENRRRSYQGSEIIITPPHNIDVKNYITRMKFFDINPHYNSEHPYNEYSSTGRFIELKRFDKINQQEINQELTEIIKTINCPDDLQIILAYCFTEVIDNTCCHAETVDGGFICGQKYAQEIHISIVDHGIGIPGSMRTFETYKNLDDCKLLELSVKENISSKINDRERDHQGFGLFALSEFVRLSSGGLDIYSNGAHLSSNGEHTTIRSIPPWTGTIINFKYPLNYNALFWAEVLNEVFAKRRYAIPEHFIDTDIF